MVTIHDLIFERYPELYPAIDRRIYRLKFRSAARRARLVVAASEETRQDLVELYGVPRARIRVVYQVCHPAFRAPADPAADAALRARLALPATFLLPVGTLERRKNLLLALRALAPARGRIARRGRPADAVRARARRVRRAARARGAGPLPAGLPMPELAALYRLATAFVYPSIFEGFGIPILEALAAGHARRHDTRRRLRRGGRPGSAYVDPRDPDELRAVLASLLADPARRADMRAAAARTPAVPRRGDCRRRSSASTRRRSW